MDNFKIKIINFIESYLKKHVGDTALWDYYILDFEEDFKYIKVYYHTWEGNNNVKEYTRHFIKIPLIID